MASLRRRVDLGVSVAVNFVRIYSRSDCCGQGLSQGFEIRVGSSLGDTSLDGLTFSVLVNWPGAIHQGNGEGLILVDERADDAQREAMETLLSGEVGGPWGILAWTWPTVHGPKPVAFELDLNGIHSRVKAGDSLEVESTTIKNPVTGAEVHPGAVLPEGLVFKRGDFGASSVFRVQDGISWDHSGQYTAVARFEYAGP